MACTVQTAPCPTQTIRGPVPPLLFSVMCSDSRLPRLPQPVLLAKRTSYRVAGLPLCAAETDFSTRAAIR